MQVTNETILELAEKYLSKKGKDDVEELIMEKKVDRAQAYVAGALDALWERGDIKDTEAGAAFQKLGVSTDDLIFYSKQKVQ